MTSPCTVSVVLGSFNREPFLRHAIDCIRTNGIRDPHEIIVVDGGSTDGSLEWLARQKDIVTIVQHNRGTFRGRPIERKSWGYFMNLGFRSARGRYILMISDDCLLLPGAVAAGVDLFDARRKEGRKVGGVAFYYRNWPEEKDYYVQLTLGRKMMVNHGLFLREALEQVGWADEERYAFYKADGDLCLKLWQAGYEIVDSPGSLVEHHAKANPSVRATNEGSLLVQDRLSYHRRWQDTYAVPAVDEVLRVSRSFSDPARTADRFGAPPPEDETEPAASPGPTAMSRLKTFIAKAARPFRGRSLVSGGRQGFPDWKTLLDTNRPLWDRSLRQAREGPRILLATSVGGLSSMTTVESLVAAALTLRGASVETLLCDKALPACLRAENADVKDPGVFGRYELSKLLCDDCHGGGRHVFDPMGLKGHEYGALLSPRDRSEARRIALETPYADIPRFRQGAWSVGEHAHAGALRYYASGHLDGLPGAEVVVRRFLEAGLLTAFATDKLLQTQRYTAALFNHGIYCPHGVIGEVCRQGGVRVVNWNVAYRKRCFIFSHGDTYHHTMLDEPVSNWESMPWSGEREAEILDYLKSRRVGSRDWIWFHEKPDEDVDVFARRIGLDFSRPVIGLLTNVMWDAQLHYRANAFPSLLSWALKTIEYFRKRPDLQLLIRVHPAEIRGTMPSKQPILAEIARVLPQLPKNVFVIPPESPVSTYASMLKCNAVLIYGTKTGTELASEGVPVVVGGEAWIRGKGMTLDASSEEEYVRILDRLPLPGRMDEAQTKRARMYAYHFFFRRMIPLSSIAPAKGWPPYRIDIRNLDELLPGVDPGLDLICDGILKGSPFVYPAERLGVKA